MIALTMTLPAAAADEQPEPSTPSTTTWSVVPSGIQGPDDRRRIEVDVDPGQSIQDHIAVRNFGTEDTTFSLSAADGYLTENGRFNMLTADRTSTDAGTWIALPARVDVAAGATVVVPVEIAVPDDATPGDHVAGIAASITSVSKSDSGSGVGLESRVGIRAVFHVRGERRSALDVSSIMDFHQNLNPFLPGSATVTSILTNNGNTVLSVVPTTTISGPFGVAARAQTAAEIEILPGGSHTVRQEFSATWPLGVMTTRVKAIFSDGAGAAEATTTAAAIPWPQIVILTTLFGLCVWISRARAASRRRLAEMLEVARYEGAAAAAAAAAGKS